MFILLYTELFLNGDIWNPKLANESEGNKVRGHNTL